MGHQKAAMEAWEVSLDSQGEGVDLVTPWSTVGYARWMTAPYSQPCVRHPDCGDVGPRDRKHLSMVAGLADALSGTTDGMYLRYPLGLEMQPLSRVQSALIVGESHRTVEHWRTPRAQTNASRALNQPHHVSLVMHPVEKHVVHSQWRVQERYESGLVGLVDDHSP